MGATEGTWRKKKRKKKSRKSENLMEPKAGAQKDNLNVHYPKTGC